MGPKEARNADLEIAGSRRRRASTPKVGRASCHHRSTAIARLARNLLKGSLLPVVPPMDEPPIRTTGCARGATLEGNRRLGEPDTESRIGG